MGLILFARNCHSGKQIHQLTDSFRETVGRDDLLILIDQEGGRVVRLKPPEFRAAPPARVFGELAANSIERAREATRLNSRLIAWELESLGINVDCLPVLDVPVPGSHDIIGDRAYGAEPNLIGDLGGAAANGLLAGGVLPVMKHIPGHGRAGADSHRALPVVDAPLSDLSRTDFAAFMALNHLPLAMTAHVVYTAIDPELPATTSAIVIDSVIRKQIGFDGLLMSDDVSMEALSGPVAERARAALDAGCDVVLHCNGDMEEMIAIAAAVGDEMSTEAKRRAAASVIAIRQPEPFDPEQGLSRLNQLLAPE